MKQMQAGMSEDTSSDAKRCTASAPEVIRRGPVNCKLGIGIWMGNRGPPACFAAASWAASALIIAACADAVSSCVVGASSLGSPQFAGAELWFGGREAGFPARCRLDGDWDGSSRNTESTHASALREPIPCDNGKKGVRTTGAV